jgi:hypothetical protein
LASLLLFFQHQEFFEIQQAAAEAAWESYNDR